MDQRSALLQVLTQNSNHFKGGRRYYTGEPVKLCLKPDVVPFQAKPFAILLVNCKVMEDELCRQCNTGALQHLTPEEYEERKWACPAFGIPKKNGTIRLIVDFRRIKANLICWASISTWAIRPFLWTTWLKKSSQSLSHSDRSNASHYQWESCPQWSIFSRTWERRSPALISMTSYISRAQHSTNISRSLTKFSSS